MMRLAPFLFFLCVFPLRNIRKIGAGIRALGRTLRSVDPIDQGLVGYLFAAFAVSFFLTLIPPSGAEYDSLTYHLAGPAQYLRAGRIVELRYDHHSYFPFTMEMLYLYALAWRGPVFAKLFHWLTLPLCCTALVAIGGRHLSRRVGLIAACMYASMPMVAAEASTAYIDLGFTMFSVLAVMCYLNVDETENAPWGSHWLWMSGLFCGFAMGTKYLGWLIFGGLGIAFLARQLRAGKIQPRLLVALALPALAIGGPWYIRNYLWVGNPVYPFAYGIFHGAGWTKAMAVQYDADQARYGFGKGLLDLIWLPWRLAMTPMNIVVGNNGVVGLPFWPIRSDVTANPPFYGVFDVPVGDVLSRIFPGPVLLAFGVPAALLPNKPRAVKFCLGFFAYLFLFWMLTSQQIRYLLPGLALLTIPAAWAVTEMSQKYRVAGLVSSACLALWLLFVPVLEWHQATSLRAERQVLFGQITPHEYLMRTFPAYLAMDWANHNTPTDAKFAVYGEPRCYYLDRPYFWADPEHNTLVSSQGVNDGADLARALKNLGASYVLVDTDPGHTGGAFGPPPQFEQAVDDGLISTVFTSENYPYRIYHIE